MRVVVDLPEKQNGLEAAVLKQIPEIQRQLMGLVKTQQTHQQSVRSEFLQAMRQQQQSLLSAMERLIGMVGRSLNVSKPSDGMVSAVQGLKQTVARLPDSLRDALNRQASQRPATPAPRVSVSPKVTVTVPRTLTNRLDGLETAVLQGLHRSRNRTFGSNY